MGNKQPQRYYIQILSVVIFIFSLDEALGEKHIRNLKSFEFQGNPWMNSEWGKVGLVQDTQSGLMISSIGKQKVELEVENQNVFTNTFYSDMRPMQEYHPNNNLNPCMINQRYFEVVYNAPLISEIKNKEQSTFKYAEPYLFLVNDLYEFSVYQLGVKDDSSNNDQIKSPNYQLKLLHTANFQDQINEPRDSQYFNIEFTDDLSVAILVSEYASLLVRYSRLTEELPPTFQQIQLFNGIGSPIVKLDSIFYYFFNLYVVGDGKLQVFQININSENRIQYLGTLGNPELFPDSQQQTLKNITDVYIDDQHSIYILDQVEGVVIAKIAMDKLQNFQYIMTIKDVVGGVKMAVRNNSTMLVIEELVQSVYNTMQVQFDMYSKKSLLKSSFMKEPQPDFMAVYSNIGMLSLDNGKHNIFYLGQNPQFSSPSKKKFTIVVEQDLFNIQMTKTVEGRNNSNFMILELGDQALRLLQIRPKPPTIVCTKTDHSLYGTHHYEISTYNSYCAKMRNQNISEFYWNYCEVKFQVKFNSIQVIVDEDAKEWIIALITTGCIISLICILLSAYRVYRDCKKIDNLEAQQIEIQNMQYEDLKEVDKDGKDND